MREKISACVTCCDEESKIRRCLESLTWCDEIVVVDSFSKDRTVEICREYTDRVHQHEWLGYIGQRNLIRKMATHPWVLFLDADEEVTVELRQEILQEFEKGSGVYVGYEFPRLVHYLGRFIRHGSWYPDLKLRLFKKTYGSIVGREPHDRVMVDGPVKTLRHPILHYTYDDIYDHLRQINRFSTITALEKFKEGERFAWMDILFRPPWRFLRGYVIKRGFMEGFHGFLIALIGSFEVAMKYAKIREQEIQAKQKSQSG